MTQKVYFPAVLLAVLMSFAAVAPAEAQDPTGRGGGATAAAYPTLITAVRDVRVQLEAVARTHMDTARIAIIDIADIVQGENLVRFGRLMEEQVLEIEHLRTRLAENERLLSRLPVYLKAAEIDEEPAEFMARVVAVDVDRETNSIVLYYDGR
jgi:hypothetical protein